MAIFIYLFGGLALIWYLLSPTYRRKTNDRWRQTRPHKLVFEIGIGIIGLVILIALVALIVDRLID